MASTPAFIPPPSEVIIHADESCLGNQFVGRANRGGAAGLVEFWNGGAWVRRDYWISEPDTTNNRMALRSAIEGLHGLSRICVVRFVSDSQYLVRGMREWLPGWKAKGWRRKGGEIENLDLWKVLDEEATKHSVLWEWVKGHAGHPRNEYVNHLAISAAEQQNASEGFQESGFEEWLEKERTSKRRYLDFKEAAPPPQK